MFHSSAQFASPRARRMRSAATKRHLWEAASADTPAAMVPPCGNESDSSIPSYSLTDNEIIRVDAMLNMLSCRLALAVRKEVQEQCKKHVSIDPILLLRLPELLIIRCQPSDRLL